MNEIFLGAGKIALRLLLAVTVFGYSRRFLENIPAFLRTDVHHVGNLALTYDGISVASHSGIHEKLVYVLETD